jgi:hypothetical protein
MQENDDQDASDGGSNAHRDTRKGNSGAGSGEDSTRDIRVGRLDSIEAVRNEMGRLYRAARRVAGAKPSPAEATKLGWLLNAIGQSILSTELESRIQALEAKDAEGNKQ